MAELPNMLPVPKTGATAPPVKPASTTSTPSLYDQALAQAQSALQAQIDPLNTQIQSNDANTAQRVSDAISNAQALSDMLKQIAPAIQGVYSNAAQDQGILGKGFSQATQASLDTNAAGIDKTLAGIGAPAGQNIDPSQSGKVADVLYGLGGFIPGQTFAQKGAAYAGAAAMLPATALLSGAQNAQQARMAGAGIDAGLQNKIAELAGKLPGDVQTNYMNLQKLALDNKKFAETLKNDSFNKTMKIAAAKLAVAKYNTGIDEFNIKTKLKGQSLQLQSNKFAQQQWYQNQELKATWARIGISNKTLALRAAAQEYKLKNGGFTASQVNGFTATLQSLQNDIQTKPGGRNVTTSSNGVVTDNGVITQYFVPKNKAEAQAGKATKPITYAQFVAQAVAHKVPVSMAMERANTIFPETQRPTPQELAPLLGLSQAAVSVGSGFNKQTTAYQQTTGQILGTSPNGVDIHWAAPKNLSAKGKQAVTGVLSLAQEYLGTPYAWGGASPTGFDCSGLAQYIYAKEGITIPRTTYEQFQSGLAVPKGQLAAGDLVFFNGSDAKNGLPGHVGIYIGNNKFIEAPHTGDVVKVSTLSGYPGYRGARRFVH